MHVKSVESSNALPLWCGAVVKRGSAISGVVVSPWFKFTRFVAKSPRVAEQWDGNNHSLTSLKILRAERANAH
ncbi:hypothetical protein TNCV_2127631 [Trichonephila clavipes]|nr:hypothetical protein TNCV_2127631 [Trichonephila clavipes]